MSNDMNPEETMLDELRRSYVKEGVLEPRTPHDKATNSVNMADGTLRQHHLEVETQIQKALSQVTQKMTSAQSVQGITYLVKEISDLLSGGDDTLTKNKQAIHNLVDTLDGQVDMIRESMATEISKSLTSSITSLAEANSALLQSRDLDSVYTNIKALKQLLQDQGPHPQGKVH